MERAGLLRRGENCWRIEDATRVGTLIDGEAYSHALLEAVRRARHSILIVGWDFDPRIALVRGDSTEGDGVVHAVLEDVLHGALDHHPELEVHILVWDFAMIYAFERDWTPLFKLHSGTHPRLHYHADSHHPVGASHHQKVVVVDDTIAFCGGMDLSKWRWDTSEHRPADPRREDPAGGAYPAIHDLQLCVEGAVARALGDLARARWQRATGEEIEPPPPRDESLWPESCEVDFDNVSVAVSRTQAEYDGLPAVREVEQLYVDAIRSARHRIYIENQYLTAHTIGEALAEVLDREEGPEVVLVLPERCAGWLEQSTMGVLRQKLIVRLREADRFGRLGVFYPAIGDSGETLLVHSKVMIVDDTLLRVASSNLSNRSMGLDTECDLSVEGCGRSEVSARIAEIRNRLLAEHLGVTTERVTETLEAEGSIAGTIARLGGSGTRRLEKLEPEHAAERWLDVLPESGIADPEKPISLEQYLEYYAPDEGEGAILRPVWNSVLILALVGIVLIAWLATPLREWMEASRIRPWLESLDGKVLAPVAAVGAFLLGTLVLIPVGVLAAAAGIAFGALEGSLYAFLGALVASVAGYGLGRLLGRDLVRRLGGPWVNRLSRRMGQRGAFTVVFLRLVPLAPFTIVNFVAGASHICVRQFALGSAVGLLPGTVAIALVGSRVGAAVRDPSTASLLANVGIILAVVAVLAGVGVFLRSRLGKKTPSDRDGRDGLPPATK